MFWKAANVNGKIIPNKCSLKEQGVQRLCKCVKPTPAHCSTKGYLKHKSAFILPHLGSATKETRTAMANLAIDNIDEFFKTGSCKNKVN